ncbi:MAG TPA: ABC transporter substrate binding protein [Terrimicrobiaceae bacterium]|nr:ABC transporter substrate binding protein [Terrimicrobiaceae bacterium]
MFEARSPSEFDSAFQKMERARVDGLVTAIDPLFFAGRQRLAELAIAQRLPSIHVNGDAVESGFLMSYGTNHEATFHRTPLYVDRLLKGARPEDLPVEQPTTFEICINMRTARAIGVKIPQSVLLQAQKIVE